MSTITPAASRAPTDVGPKVDAGSGEAKPERSFWQRAFGDDGLTFSTLLDVVNPLQHIPVVSTIYREVTGDKIAPAAKLIGDTLFGGPIGLALSAVDVTVQGETGKDMGQHVVAMFNPNTTSDSDTAIATASTGSTGLTTSSIAWNQPRPEEAPGIADNAKPAQLASAAPSASVPTTEKAEKVEEPKPTQVASLAPPANPAADPAAYVPRSAFVAAAMKPRAPSNGINGAYVPLETRSTIAPPAMFAPVSLAIPAPRDDMTKPVEKNVVALPDAKSVAADPKMLQSLRANGARPTRAQNASHGPSVTLPMPPALPLATPADVGAGSNDVADVMARNLERYMALRNRRPAPTKVDGAF
jgi:hypothetical protein